MTSPHMNKFDLPRKDYKGKLVFDVEGKEYRAAGFCFYNGTGSEAKIMMIKSDRGWEFPGGKVDESDLSLYDTALREAVEETNGCIGNSEKEKGKFGYATSVVDCDRHVLANELEISRRRVDEMLSVCDTYVDWIPEYRFKYGLFITEVPDSWVRESAEYGEVELWEDIPRTVEWLPAARALEIIKDDSVGKFMMLKMNTYLKKCMVKWLESGCMFEGAFRKWLFER